MVKLVLHFAEAYFQLSHGCNRNCNIVICILPMSIFEKQMGPSLNIIWIQLTWVLCANGCFWQLCVLGPHGNESLGWEELADILPINFIELKIFKHGWPWSLWGDFEVEITYSPWTLPQLKFADLTLRYLSSNSSFKMLEMGYLSFLNDLSFYDNAFYDNALNIEDPCIWW